MKNLTTVRSWGLRLLATAVGGVGAAVMGDEAAMHIWQYQPELWMLALGGLVPAVGAFFASSRLATFADSVMVVSPQPPAVKTAVRPNKSDKPNSRVASAGSAAATAAAAARTKQSAAEQKGNNQKPNTPRSEQPQVAAPVVEYSVVAENDKITFRTTAIAGGYAQVSLVVTGLSKTQFKGAGGFLSKLHAVPGVGWSAHKNIGGHRKEIVGKVSAEKLDGVSTQLKDLVSTYSK